MKLILPVGLIFAMKSLVIAQSSKSSSTNPVTAAGTLRDLTTPPSYYQQLRDLEKEQTDRIIQDKIKAYMDAPKKERKERESKDKLERLEAEEMALQRKKEEWERLEEKDQVQQQLLAKYLKRIQEQSVATNKTVSEKMRNDEFPKTPAVEEPRPVQEALKVEPPQ